MSSVNHFSSGRGNRLTSLGLKFHDDLVVLPFASIKISRKSLISARRRREVASGCNLLLGTNILGWLCLGPAWEV